MRLIKASRTLMQTNTYDRQIVSYDAGKRAYNRLIANSDCLWATYWRPDRSVVNYKQHPGSHHGDYKRRKV